MYIYIYIYMPEKTQGIQVFDASSFLLHLWLSLVIQRASHQIASCAGGIVKVLALTATGKMLQNFGFFLKNHSLHRFEHGRQQECAHHTPSRTDSLSLAGTVSLFSASSCVGNPQSCKNITPYETIPYSSRLGDMNRTSQDPAPVGLLADPHQASGCGCWRSQFVWGRLSWRFASLVSPTASTCVWGPHPATLTGGPKDI